MLTFVFAILSAPAFARDFSFDGVCKIDRYEMSDADIARARRVLRKGMYESDLEVPMDVLGLAVSAWLENGNIVIKTVIVTDNMDSSAETQNVTVMTLDPGTRNVTATFEQFIITDAVGNHPKNDGVKPTNAIRLFNDCAERKYDVATLLRRIVAIRTHSD